MRLNPRPGPEEQDLPSSMGSTESVPGVLGAVECTSMSLFEETDPIMINHSRLFKSQLLLSHTDFNLFKKI
jgi:hypothetical protein